MHWHANTAEETEAFGAQLLSARPANDAFATAHLTGDLGSGKTTLARGFLRAAGAGGAIRSPTYTLLEVYDLPGLTVVHVDLYRLHDPVELETLGLREWARPGHLWLIEWPDRGAGRLPAPDLHLALTAGSPSHTINVTAGSAFGESWLNRLLRSVPGGS